MRPFYQKNGPEPTYAIWTAYCNVQNAVRNATWGSKCWGVYDAIPRD